MTTSPTSTAAALATLTREARHAIADLRNARARGDDRGEVAARFLLVSAVVEARRLQGDGVALTPELRQAIAVVERAAA